jgi:hypothetical protein
MGDSISGVMRVRKGGYLTRTISPYGQLHRPFHSLKDFWFARQLVVG